MNSCEYVAQITAISCALARGKSDKDLALLASLFTQIGNNLSAMIVYKEVCDSKDEK